MVADLIPAYSMLQFPRLFALKERRLRLCRWRSSASGQWNLCESRTGNAGVTIMAQKKQLEINENARLLVVANKRGEAQAKALDKAQTAL